MAQSNFIQALNDCIDRLNAGQSMDECLRLYPHYAADLRPLLEAGTQVRRVGADARAVAQAQARMRGRVLATYDQTMRPARPRLGRATRPGWAFVAALALIVVLGAVVLANRPRQDIVPLSQPTASVTPTVTEAAATPTPDTPTHTPTGVITATSTATGTPTLTPATIEATDSTLAACVPTLPDGWVTYTVQSGDTLSHLAAATGTTPEELMVINCIEDVRLIVAGQPVFLPNTPGTPGTPTAPDTPATPDDDSGDDGSGGGEDNSGSGGGEDNSGSGGGDDDGGDSHDDEPEHEIESD
ncbi:MAG: LysM peptidoglycan-binding domain-containing protein [Anaerolineae bacterium]|nr:LysM peptidoglycan-binding domain-containing protein [Anaerolineae bacterium]